MPTKPRPKYLDLFTLAPKMSITAKVSILHRITGFLLFLSIPFVLYVLHKSLTSPDFYSSFYGVISTPIVKLIYLLFIFVFMYHMCAGVRYLFLDMDKGVEVHKAKLTAKIVIVVSILLTVILGAIIW